VRIRIYNAFKMSFVHNLENEMDLVCVTFQLEGKIVLKWDNLRDTEDK
jgi:hypothetical protein